MQVFIVTGGASGIGKELVQILYSHNAKFISLPDPQKRLPLQLNQSRPAFPTRKANWSTSTSISMT
jgi:retinol dehydrogenase 12